MVSRGETSPRHLRLSLDCSGRFRSLGVVIRRPMAHGSGELESVPNVLNLRVMRLTDYQRLAIREAIDETFGTDAGVWLFGSRTDDTRRGGDIDLMVEVRDMEPSSIEAVERKLRAVSAIQRRIGDRKIDLIVTDGTTATPIAEAARRDGVPV